jgi:hypothetical protein
MGNNRIVYQEWIVELGRDPALPPVSGTVDPTSFGGRDREVGSALTADINRAVREALGKLGEAEREFIERFYFQGMSYRNLSEGTGRSRHKLEALHYRAVRALRSLLAEFVRERFGIEPQDSPDCPICRSAQREAIDSIIQTRDPAATWRPVISRIRDEFGVVLTTPQTLIGHEKYH